MYVLELDMQVVATSLWSNWCDPLFGSKAQVSEHFPGWSVFRSYWVLILWDWWIAVLVTQYTIRHLYDIPSSSFVSIYKPAWRTQNIWVWRIKKWQVLWSFIYLISCVSYLTYKCPGSLEIQGFLFLLSLVYESITTNSDAYIRNAPYVSRSRCYPACVVIIQQ